MALLLPPKNNRSWIVYLLIVLLFMLLAGGVFIFFTSRIRSLDKGNGYTGTLKTIQVPFTKNERSNA